MKIVCESCGAKYSIADEKVAGKVFKIRCKRCSEVIIVRGDQDEPGDAGAAASQAYNYAADAIWHVVVDGEQAGPYTPGQLGEMLTAGSVDWEAYVWAEGFDNWVPMRDVEDLVSQITGQEQQPASTADAYGSAGADTLAAQSSMGADPFADEPAPSEQGLFGGAPADEGPDLFGGGGDSGYAQPAAAAQGDAGVVSSSPSPRVSSEQAMTGARNENSVLFSLKNLQALATGSSSPSVPPAGGGGGFAAAPAPAPAPGTGDGPAAGIAGGEGSGLIDIRALASTTGVGDAAEAGEKDELLSMGSQGGAFGALGSPMLAPAAAEETDGGKKAYIWAAVAVVGLLSLAGVAVAFIMRPVESGPAPVTAAAPPAAPATAAAANPTPAEPDKAEEARPKSEGAAAAEAAAEADEDDGEKKSSSKKRRRKSSGSSSSSAKKAADTALLDEVETKKPSKPSGPRTLDDLLDGALSGKKKKKKAAAPAPSSNLPKTPSRNDVISALKGVKGAVAACGKGQSGIATVQVTVAGSTGRVTNAQVSGVTGPPGSCIAKAVRKAKFPKFQQKVFKVKYPFKL